MNSKILFLKVCFYKSKTIQGFLTLCASKAYNWKKLYSTLEVSLMTKVLKYLLKMATMSTSSLRWTTTVKPCSLYRSSRLLTWSISAIHPSTMMANLFVTGMWLSTLKYLMIRLQNKKGETSICMTSAVMSSLKLLKICVGGKKIRNFWSPLTF